MLTVLFNPNGRIGPRTFWRGVFLLLAAMIIVSVAGAYGGAAGQALGIFSLAAPYCYLCVYGKRLHDNGKSAWLFLAFLAGYFVVSSGLSMVLMPFLSPGVAPLEAQMTLLIEQGQLMDAINYAPEINKAGIMTSLVSLIASNALLGFIAASLSSDPQSNAYGPPEGGLASDTF
ncbi:MAG: DUF805 domain-containing protein [Pseudomonadota bacterium]